MGQLTLREATSIWVAAIDHAQAILTEHQAEQQALASGDSVDSMRTINAQNKTGEARDTLRARLAKHIDTTNE